MPTNFAQSASLRDNPRSPGVEFFGSGNNAPMREPDWRNGMQNTIIKPIFLVGSPRSGTSILTWCLGQHPNIFPVDESTGIGELALALAVCYQTKMGLGPDSLWSAMNMQREEFIATFGQTINELIQRHKVDLERKWWKQAFAPNAPPHDFVAKQPPILQKRDGSMEPRHIRFTFAGCVNFSPTRCSFTSSATSLLWCGRCSTFTASPA